MPRVYSSKELRRKVQAISNFIEAAEAYRQDRGNAELKARVAEAAGRASGAAEMANLLSVHTDAPIAGGRSIKYDAIASWDAQLAPTQDQLVIAIDTAHQVRGTLESMAEDADREERSLVGWVARFVGFPGRVRKYLEDRGFSTGAQTAGFVVSIGVQVVGGLIVAWIVYVIGWA